MHTAGSAASLGSDLVLLSYNMYIHLFWMVVKNPFHYARTSIASGSSLGTSVRFTPNQIEYSAGKKLSLVFSSGAHGGAQTAAT